MQLNTRKSSCMNARGIPTTAYQVLHMLSYVGGGEYLPFAGGGEVPWGIPLPPPSGPGQGTSPLPVWTDWKHYLPNPSDAVGKNLGFITQYKVYNRVLPELIQKLGRWRQTAWNPRDRFWWPSFSWSIFTWQGQIYFWVTLWNTSNTCYRPHPKDWAR